MSSCTIQYIHGFVEYSTWCFVARRQSVLDHRAEAACPDIAVFLRACSANTICPDGNNKIVGLIVEVAHAGYDLESEPNDANEVLHASVHPTCMIVHEVKNLTRSFVEQQL